MPNTAQDVLLPTDPEVLVRVVVLHVGQGASVLVLAADGPSYRTMLVDTNLDATSEAVDVPRLMTDLVGDSGLDVFVNTHPHRDHLCGVSELADAVSIKSVWHSGHLPGKDDRDGYDRLQKVITKVRKLGGSVETLLGSRTPVAFGEAQCYILAPAEYVTDEIGDEKPEVRRQRIHEHCAVLRIGAGDTWVMVPGDADLQAWQNHITDYHEERLQSVLLVASHHGSRSFFVDNEGDAPYLKALQAIGPDYVVIPAPRTKESPHGHPHDDAIALYADQVGEDNLLHTGESRYSFICDIYRDGQYAVVDDQGRLAQEYVYAPKQEDEDSSEGKRSAVVFPAVVTRVDRRPMGSG